MNFRNIRIIGSVAFALLAFFCGYKLYKSINDTLILTKKIETNEIIVKQQLVFLKEMQLKYYENNKEYTDNWDTLTQFIKNDTLYNIDKHEHIINLYAGKDSSYYTYDTISYAKVYDSLFVNNELGLSLSNYYILPHKPKEKFTIELGTVDGVNVFQITDPFPVDPKKESGIKQKLRIGSLKSAKTKGSWEK